MIIDFKKYPYPERLRHHTTPYNYIPLKELKGTPEFYPPLYNNIDWKDIFINGKQPNILDVGCGKAGLLLQFAEDNPEMNVLGIEVRDTLAYWAENLIKGENIKNAAVIWYSVVNGLDFIDENSISKIFYLFPDPWSKTKHKKRRAFNQNTLNEYHRLLKDDGQLFLASDLEEIHDYHKGVIDADGRFTYKIIDTVEEWGLPITNKETFCKKKHIPVFRLIANKK